MRFGSSKRNYGNIACIKKRANAGCLEVKIMRYVTSAIIVLLAVVAFSMPANATETETGWALFANAVLIHQTASTAVVGNEASGSADFIVSHANADATGQWLIHLEASTSTSSTDISAVYPEANADAGSALDEHGNGRLQLSELYYAYVLSDQHSISAGLLDVSGFFEQSRIASDETTQFLGASFTGNPTIAFPDYTLGAIYQHGLSSDLVLRAGLASSNGLADNDSRSYAQLFTVTGDDKGVFGILSLSWQAQGWLVRAGSWLSTANYTPFNETEDNLNNYGYYLLTGYKYGRHAVNVRLGYANPKVSLGKAFSSVSYLYQLGRYSVGIGAAQSVVSHQATEPAASNTSHYEAFIRYRLSPAWLATADVQHINNSNFTASATDPARDANLWGLRLTWLYN